MMPNSRVLRWWVAALSVLVALSLLIFTIRATGLATRGDLVDPLGQQGPPLYSIWKVAHGHPLYEHPDRDQLTLTLYNYLFYQTYATTLGALGIDGRAMVFGSQVMTAVLCVALVFLTVRLIRTFVADSSPILSVGIFLVAVFIWFGTAPMGWWHLSIRPDALALTFAASGLLVCLRGLRRPSPPGWLLLASICFYGAWASKQSCIATLAGLSCYLLFVRRRLSLAVCLAGPAALLMALTLLMGSDEYRRNLLWVPSVSRISLSPIALEKLFKVIVANGMTWVFPVAVALVTMRSRLRASLWDGLSPLVCTSVIAVTAGVLAMMREGGEDNSILEAHLSLGVLATVLFVRLAAISPLPRLVTRLAPVLLAAMIVYPAAQVALKRAPMHVATDEEYATRTALVTYMQTLPGPVFVFDGMLSQPWFSNHGRYPAFVPDTFWIEIAHREHLLEDDGITPLMRRHFFGALLLPARPLQLRRNAVESGYSVVDSGELSRAQPYLTYLAPNSWGVLLRRLLIW